MFFVSSLVATARPVGRFRAPLLSLGLFRAHQTSQTKKKVETVLSISFDAVIKVNQVTSFPIRHKPLIAKFK
jgi:hypothetical protein